MPVPWHSSWLVQQPHSKQVVGSIPATSFSFLLEAVVICEESGHWGLDIERPMEAQLAYLLDFMHSIASCMRSLW